MTDVGDSFAPLPPASKPRGMTIFLALGVLVGLVSLGLGLRAELENRHQNNQREQDRIEADLEGCERSNAALAVARTVATTLQVYVDGILSGVADFARLSDAERLMLDQELRDDREAIGDAIASIETIDCSAVVPGAEP